VQATCELALEILRAGTTDPFSKDDTRNIQQETVDVISTTYFAPGDRARGLALFPTVTGLIAPLLRSAGATLVERV
ncbi:MAG TPA: DnaT-like ssDNA-binding protein, partial [Gemmatimonadaceae bacterium]|nr:DnaT-like ssDNA-binding protein [Gemmatimonadaceae bacterium]